jgi:hypothetical protein
LGGLLVITPALLLVVFPSLPSARAALLSACCGCSSLVLRGWLVCDSFLGLGKSYASTTLGGFLIVSGFTRLCIMFLSVLWLLLAGMVCILVPFVPVEPRLWFNSSLTTFVVPYKPSC